MPVELTAALSIVLVVIGVCGIVVPVLPGSLAIVGGLLLWALVGGSPYGWVVFAIGTTFAAAGATAQFLITGRRLREREIPNRSVVIALIAGVVGLFAIPFLGLPIGFVAGLLVAEYVRVQNVREAMSSSFAAVKSVGLGMLVELCCGLAAATTLLVGIVARLST